MTEGPSRRRVLGLAAGAGLAAVGLSIAATGERVAALVADAFADRPVRPTRDEEVGLVQDRPQRTASDEGRVGPRGGGRSG